MTEQEKREKVINGLEDTYQHYSVVKGQGFLIDKRNGDEYAWIDPELITAALALLKKQEPVEPVQDMVGDALFWVCGSCGHDVSSSDWYCANCGRAVKWE